MSLQTRPARRVIVRTIALGLTLTTGLAVTGAAPVSAAPPERCANADALLAEVGPEATAAGALCLVNVERRKRGLRPLRSSAALAAAAREHGTDMVLHRFIGHLSSAGEAFLARLVRAGYGDERRPAALVGENLAWGTGERATPRQIVRAWMRSRTHRRSIVEPRFREIGIAVVEGTPAAAPALGATYVACFGARVAP